MTVFWGLHKMCSLCSLCKCRLLWNIKELWYYEELIFKTIHELPMGIHTQYSPLNRRRHNYVNHILVSPCTVGYISSAFFCEPVCPSVCVNLSTVDTYFENMPLIQWIHNNRNTQMFVLQFAALEEVKKYKFYLGTVIIISFNYVSWLWKFNTLNQWTYIVDMSCRYGNSV